MAKGQPFQTFLELDLFREFLEIHNFLGSVIAAWGLAANWSLGGEKMLLYVFCFASSLLQLLLSLVVLVLVFPLQSC